MEIIAAVKLAAKFAPHTIKAAKRVKGILDEHKIKKDLEDSLKDAEKAFVCYPRATRGDISISW